MKRLLFSLLLTSSIFGMQPQSKNDCFLAHTKFKGMITLLSGNNWRPIDKEGNVVQKNFDVMYEEFLQECREEALQKSKEKLLIEKAVSGKIEPKLMIEGLINGSIEAKNIDIQL